MADIFDQPAFMQRLKAVNSSLNPRPFVDGRYTDMVPRSNPIVLNANARMWGQYG